MQSPDLANLTAQYQQAYLIYCYKVMQYLQVLAWMEQQQRSPKHKAKPKSTSGVKKLAPNPNQQKSNLNLLKHQEKLVVSTIVTLGYAKGRIYDAALGRVLQADPFVQDPTNTQSFNRYTYVFNNPLSYTDPSGYFSLRQALGFAVGLVLSIFNPFALGVFWSAFVAGFASSLIITGNLKTALISGLIAGSIAFVGDKIIPKKVADKVDSKTVNKKLDPGASLDATTGNSQFKQIPAPTIPDATGKAFENLIDNTSLNAPSSIGDSITGSGGSVAGDVVKVKLQGATVYLSEATISPGTFSIGNLINEMIAGGVAAGLALKWADQLQGTTVDDQFPDLDRQLIANRGAADAIRKAALRNHFHNLHYATFQEKLLTGMLSPLSLYGAEGILAGGKVLTEKTLLGVNVIRTRFAAVSSQFKADFVLGTMDITSLIAGGLTREQVIAGFLVELRRQAHQVLIQKGVQREVINNILKILPK